MNVTRALSTRLPGMKTGQFASIPAGILAARRGVRIFCRRTIEWAPAASDNPPLQYPDTADPGVFINLGNSIRPIWVECFQVSAAPFDDQLSEGGFIRVFKLYDDVVATVRRRVRVHENEIPIVEPGLHAGPFDAQYEGPLAATNRAGQ